MSQPTVRMARTGICEVCGFRGLLSPREYIAPSAFDRPIDPYSDPSTKNMCMTCFDTPIGCVSENQYWIRLERKKDE